MNNYNKRGSRNKTYKRHYVAHKRDTERKQNKAHKMYKQRLVRGQLFHLLGKEVNLSAVLAKHYLKSTMENNKAVLFTDCVVESEFYEQHFWIVIPRDVRIKLLMAPNEARIYFKGTPHTYTSRHDHESDKIGIKDIELVTQIN